MGYHSEIPVSKNGKAAKWKQNSNEVEASVSKQMDEVYNPIFKCPQCPKEFKMQRYLTNHLKSHETSANQKLDKKKQYQQLRRKNPEYCEKESEKNQKHKAEKRQDPEYCKKETEKRQDPEYHEKEAAVNKKHMAEKRKDPEYHEKEAVVNKKHKAEKRKDPEYHDKEAAV